MQITAPEIDAYADQMTTEPPAALQQLAHQTLTERDDANMLSGKMVSGLLAMLVHATRARRVLEVGTFTGYATLTMAQALTSPDGRVTTVEFDERNAALARATFDGIDGGDRIDIVTGPALEVLPTLDGPWDVAFIDAAKREYGAYLDAILPKMSPHGIIAIDNTLRRGSVLQSDADETTRIIDRFNQSVAHDERMVSLLIPLRDGVTLIRRR